MFDSSLNRRPDAAPFSESKVKVVTEKKLSSESSQSTGNLQTSSGKSQEQLAYEAEQVANQARQNEYDTWKSKAIQEGLNVWILH